MNRSASDHQDAAVPPDLLWSARRTAKAMSISDRSLWTLTHTGEIPHVRIGRRVLYRPESVQQWLAGREQRGNRNAGASTHSDSTSS